MWPSGILGTRADLLMDIILIAVVAVPFLLLYSFARVRNRDYESHKKIQWTLFVVVLAAVVLFELNIQVTGGYLMQASSFAQTGLFHSLLYSHILVAVLTFSVWGGLLLFSGKKSKKAHLPGGFSLSHKKLGKFIFGGSVFTALSGGAVYVVSFVL